MLDWFHIGQWALLTLACILCIIAWQKSKRLMQDARRRAREFYWPCKGFDVSSISPQLRKVREEPLKALQSRRPRQPGYFHEGLLAAARDWISQLSFFHHASAEHDLQKHKT